jgi:dienelactone hydrolase
MPGRRMPRHAHGITEEFLMAIPVTTQMVTTDSGMPVHVAKPSGTGPFPCVLVLHERYGLVQHTADLASKLAGSGYVAAAPDLFYDARIRKPCTVARSASNRPTTTSPATCTPSSAH